MRVSEGAGFFTGGADLGTGFGAGFGAGVDFLTGGEVFGAGAVRGGMAFSGTGLAAGFTLRLGVTGLPTEGCGLTVFGGAGRTSALFFSGLNVWLGKFCLPAGRGTGWGLT